MLPIKELERRLKLAPSFPIMEAPSWTNFLVSWKPRRAYSKMRDRYTPAPAIDDKRLLDSTTTVYLSPTVAIPIDDFRLQYPEYFI